MITCKMSISAGVRTYKNNSYWCVVLCVRVRVRSRVSMYVCVLSTLAKWVAETSKYAVLDCGRQREKLVRTAHLRGLHVAEPAGGVHAGAVDATRQRHYRGHRHERSHT